MYRQKMKTKLKKYFIKVAGYKSYKNQLDLYTVAMNKFKMRFKNNVIDNIREN